MKVLLATFRTAEDLHGAIAALGRDCVVEIYSPIEFGVEQAPAGSGRGLKYTAVIAGVAAFAGVYGLQWWSMDVAYSFIVGGRSEHPWPAGNRYVSFWILYTVVRVQNHGAFDGDGQ